MFVVSKRNIILPGPNGEKFHMKRDYMGPVPEWAEKSAYLRALAEDGKVILSESGTDKDVATKEKKAKKPKKPAGPSAPPKSAETSGEKGEAPGEDQDGAPDVSGE